MKYTSIFEHESKGIYSYSFGNSSLKAEKRHAMQFNGNPEFGRFLFSRPVSQVLMSTGRRYEIKLSSGVNRMRYRAEDEALSGQFDYYECTADGVLNMLIEHEVLIPELGKKGMVQVPVRFSAANAFKFQDMCKSHLMAILFENGKASFVGYKTALCQDPSIKIDLEAI